jgi:hypothetical protein
MLGEFAGFYWPQLPREKQDHERQAYASMLASCPTPPVGGTTELEAVRDQLMRMETNLREERAKSAKLQRELNRAFSLLGQAQKRARA